MSNENKSRSTTMIVAFAVVIAVVAYVGVKYPIAGDDAAGTVAPAVREIGDQISGDQVQLDDEAVSQLMQTDIYQTIIADDAFRAASRNEDFMRELRSDDVARVFGNDAAMEALRGDAGQDVMKSDALLDALRFEALREALLRETARGGQANLSDLERRGGGDAARNAALYDALSRNAKLSAARKADVELNATFEGAAFRGALSSAELRRSLDKDLLRGLMKNKEFLSAVNRSSFRTVARNPAMLNAMRNAKFRAALQNSETFRNALQRDARRELARDANRGLERNSTE